MPRKYTKKKIEKPAETAPDAPQVWDVAAEVARKLAPLSLNARHRVVNAVAALLDVRLDSP